MTKVQDLPSLDELADEDLFYVIDMSSPGSPDRKLLRSKLRPVGARITHYFRYVGNITIPTIAASAEGLATVSVTDVAVGDNVSFNPSAALAAGLGIMSVRVSAADTVEVRFRNFSASSISTAAVACTIFAIRSID